MLAIQVTIRQWSGATSGLALSCWEVDINQEQNYCLHAPFLVLCSGFPWELLVDVGYWVREI